MPTFLEVFTEGQSTIATATRANPVPDRVYDWLKVLHSKAEGLNAYQKYIQDAEREGATQCAAMFRKLHDQDARQGMEIKDHLKMALEHFKM
jgi:hypothetical protein